jgi:hypothetical protein
MKLILPLLIALFLFPGLASAQTGATVDLQAGETVQLRIATDGAVTVASRGKARPMPDFEASAFREMVATPIVADVKSQPPMPVTRTEKPAPAVAAGTARFTLRLVPPPAAKSADGDMMLTIENGYDGGALRYRAVMHRGDRATPTDVCTVIPLKRGYEHWPYRFERMTLSDLQLIPWHDGDSVTCE